MHKITSILPFLVLEMKTAVSRRDDDGHQLNTHLFWVYDCDELICRLGVRLVDDFGECFCHCWVWCERDLCDCGCGCGLDLRFKIRTLSSALYSPTRTNDVICLDCDVTCNQNTRTRPNERYVYNYFKSPLIVEQMRAIQLIIHTSIVLSTKSNYSLLRVRGWGT